MNALLLNCIFKSNKVSDINSPYRFYYKLSNYFLVHNCSFHINICYIMTGLIKPMNHSSVLFVSIITFLKCWISAKSTQWQSWFNGKTISFNVAIISVKENEYIIHFINLVYE